MSNLIQLYQPANGTEGEWFIGKWCCQCERDKSLSEGLPIEECDDDQKCDIVFRSMTYNKDEPEYPNEWRIQNGRPVCTAFVPLGESIPWPRCENTVDMFGEIEDAEDD